MESVQEHYSAMMVAIRRYAKSVDATSFVLVLNSSEIFGKGFLRG